MGHETAHASHHSESCRARVYDLLRERGAPKMLPAQQPEKTFDAKVREAIWYAKTGAPMPTGDLAKEGSSAVSSSDPWVSAPAPEPPGVLDDHVEFVQHGNHVVEAEDVDAVTLSSRKKRSEYEDALDVLQVLGVDLIDATRFVNAMRHAPPVSGMEMYGHGRMTVAAHGRRRSLILKGLGLWTYGRAKLVARHGTSEKPPTEDWPSIWSTR